MGSIRTLLALAVVFAHCPLNGGFVFVGGENAVRLFYIASGYLIALVLSVGKYTSIRSFYLNRWLRLWPMYAVVCILTTVFYLAAGTGFFSVYGDYPGPVAAAVALSNLTLFGQDWLLFFPYSTPLYRGLLAPQSWTLGLELSFYLLAPFVLRRVWIMVALLAASLALRLVLVGAGFDKDPWTYRFFPTELAWFLCGALAQRLGAPLARAAVGRHLPLASAVATAAFLAFTAIFHLLGLAYVAGAAILVVSFIAVTPLAIEFQNRHAWDRRIGELSFPIYIGHYLMLQAVSWVFQRTGGESPATLTAMGVVASVLFAWALNALVGERVERLRRRIRESRAGGLPARPVFASAAIPASKI
jgi:peptidoglycan/LPS O-acetylase OafA/YrhL